MLLASMCSSWGGGWRRGEGTYSLSVVTTILLVHEYEKLILRLLRYHMYYLGTIINNAISHILCFSLQIGLTFTFD